MLDSPAMGARGALVTGASRGIGRAVALRLASQGYAIAVNYRSGADQAAAVVRAIEEGGGRAFALPADVADPDQAAVLVGRAEEVVGPLAAVVNNAGITRDRLLIQMSVADWNATWLTDLTGPRLIARRAAERMTARKAGRIVNVSSVVGVNGSPGQANYAAAKSALLGLTRELALLCAPAGVTVNCVVPGYVPTNATAHLTAEQQENWMRQIPMRRFAGEDEIARVICFLASDGASYLTGQCIAVDGGYLAGTGAGLVS